MQPTEIAGNTLFYRTPDGRIVFRPWGRRGPCYLLTEAQRRARARIQAGYYGLMLIAVSVGAIRLGTFRLFTVVLLLWLFSIGLPTTSAPAAPPPEYREQLIRQSNRAFGRPLLWTMLVLVVGMVAAALWAGSKTGQWGTTGLVVVFFVACGAVFIWQLRNQ